MHALNIECYKSYVLIGFNDFVSNTVNYNTINNYLRYTVQY